MRPSPYPTALNRFVDNGPDRNTLAIVHGRRRIGKSTLLASLTKERDGFYWEATRAESSVQLQRLGEALGVHLNVGRIAFEGWDDAITRLLRLGANGPTPVVLDEFGYMLESDPTLDSVVASVLGPARRDAGGQCPLILCSSAMAMMRALTYGNAPLRGRASLELVMQPFDFRRASGLLGTSPDLALATRVFAVIGGVVGYATDMVDDDLPRGRDDFDRWVAQRVLSPAATLHHEAATLLSEDPTIAAANQTLHHSILGLIANGAVTAGRIANALRRQVSSLDPALKRLALAGFVVRHEDPLRAKRPLYALSDPFLQFHYAVLEPHATMLRERDPLGTWTRRLSAVFDSRVRGPVFEEQARAWVRAFASPASLGGEPDHVGPSVLVVDGTEHQLDVVVASDANGTEPGARPVLAIGEAKAGETVGVGQLQHLERARSALGSRAAHARLMLFAPAFSAALELVAENRSDVVLVGLERLYGGD